MYARVCVCMGGGHGFLVCSKCLIRVIWKLNYALFLRRLSSKSLVMKHSKNASCEFVCVARVSYYAYEYLFIYRGIIRNILLVDPFLSDIFKSFAFVTRSVIRLQYHLGKKGRILFLSIFRCLPVSIMRL